MTWALSTPISLLLRTVTPLIRRGLPHLAMAAMATLVCVAALVAGQGLIYAALWWAAEAGPMATVLVGLLGATLCLAALVGLTAVVLLMALAITAGCLTARSGSGNEHSTRTPGCAEAGAGQIRTRACRDP